MLTSSARSLGLLLLLSLPLLQLSLNANWFFNFLGWGDQWMYFGGHLEMPRKLALFSDSYRATRAGRLRSPHHRCR